LVASKRNRAVDRTCAVKDQAAVGVGSIAESLPFGNACKTVQYLLRPSVAFLLRRTQFEHRSTIAAVILVARVSFPATKLRRSVKVAELVEY
jgi:hypothetical protein